MRERAHDVIEAWIDRGQAGWALEEIVGAIKLQLRRAIAPLDSLAACSRLGSDSAVCT